MHVGFYVAKRGKGFAVVVVRVLLESVAYRALLMTCYLYRDACRSSLLSVLRAATCTAHEVAVLRAISFFEQARSMPQHEQCACCLWRLAAMLHVFIACAPCSCTDCLLLLVRPAVDAAHPFRCGLWCFLWWPWECHHRLVTCALSYCTVVGAGICSALVVIWRHSVLAEQQSCKTGSMMLLAVHA